MPNEPIKGLNTPNTGDLVGGWGTTAVNANMQAIAGMLGGFASFSLSGATTIALSAPSGSLTPGGGPTQQQNAMLRFTGVQSGTATVQFSLPGFFIIDNQCTGTTFPVVCAPATGTGTQIGVPWGAKTHVFFDGTNVDFVNPPIPGTAIDLHGVTAIPAWMTACTKQYALIKDGATYSTATYAMLGAQLGSTFGGNGVTTFGVPDEGQRMRLAWSASAGRVTSGGSGIAGNTMGAAGGDQLMQSHNHTSPALTDPGHTHTSNALTGNAGSFQVAGGNVTISNATIATSVTGITIAPNVGTTGAGGSQNMPPTIVSFLALIKT